MIVSITFTENEEALFSAFICRLVEQTVSLEPLNKPATSDQTKGLWLGSIYIIVLIMGSRQLMKAPSHCPDPIGGGNRQGTADRPADWTTHISGSHGSRSVQTPLSRSLRMRSDHQNSRWDLFFDHPGQSE